MIVGHIIRLALLRILTVTFQSVRCKFPKRFPSKLKSDFFFSLRVSITLCLFVCLLAFASLCSLTCDQAVFFWERRREKGEGKYKGGRV